MKFLRLKYYGVKLILAIYGTNLELLKSFMQHIFIRKINYNTQNWEQLILR